MTLCLVNQKIKIEVNISTMHKPRIFINIHYLSNHDYGNEAEVEKIYRLVGLE